MENRGIKFFETSPNYFRIVTHYGITKEDISIIIKKIEQILN